LCWELDVGTIEQIIHNILVQPHAKIANFWSNVRHKFSIFKFEPVWIIRENTKPRGPRASASLPGWRPNRADRLWTAVAATMPAPTASLPPLPAHRSRRHAAATLEHPPEGAPPFFLLLPLTPRLCSSSRRVDADRHAPLPELRQRAPPLHYQAGQASTASSTRMRLEPPPQPLFPGRRTPPAIKLHPALPLRRCHPNDRLCPDHLPKP
jgi:hypothetical protein